MSYIFNPFSGNFDKTIFKDWDWTIPRNIKNISTHYTLQSSDVGSLLLVDSPTPVNLFITENTNIPLKQQVDIIQIGTGMVTCTGSDWISLNAVPGNKFRSQYSSAALIGLGGNEYILNGDLIPNPPPIYYLGVNSLSANETDKNTIIFALSCENVKSKYFPLAIPYRVSGQVQPEDFTPSTSLSGFFMLLNNQIADTKTFKVLADSITDGNEIMTLTLTSVANIPCPKEANGILQNVLIYDTSPLPPGYTLHFNENTVDEISNNTFELNLTVTGVANGTIVPFRLHGNGITVSDLSGAPVLSGIFTVLGATIPPDTTPLTFTTNVYYLSADETAEGTETLFATLTSVGSIICPIPAEGKFDTLQILDTSSGFNFMTNPEIIGFRQYLNVGGDGANSNDVSGDGSTLLVCTRKGSGNGIIDRGCITIIRNENVEFKLQSNNSWGDNTYYYSSATNFNGSKIIAVNSANKYWYSFDGGNSFPSIVTNSSGLNFPTSGNVNKMQFNDGDGSLLVLFDNNRLFKNTNPTNPSSWTEIILPSGIAPLDFQTSDTSKIILNTSNGVYVYDGSNWDNQGLSETNFISSFISKDGNYFYGLTSSGKFYRKVGLNNWEPPVQLSSLFSNGILSYMQATPSGQYILAKNNIFGTNSDTSRVLISQDYGQTWFLVKLPADKYVPDLSSFTSKAEIYFDSLNNKLKMFFVGTREIMTTDIILQ